MDAYADLIVRVGANVQEGQDVVVMGWIDHAPLMRPVVDAAYRAGARYVEMSYRDDYGRRSLAEHGAEDVLSWTPPHSLARLQDWADRRGAYVETPRGARPSPVGGDEPSPGREAGADRGGEGAP